MKVRVEAYYPGYTGTFGICYSTTNTRPSIGFAYTSINVGSSYYPGNMTTAVGTYQYLRVYLSSGNQYRVDWKDCDNMNSTDYTDISVGLRRESTDVTVVSVDDRPSTNAFTYAPTYSDYYYIVIYKRDYASRSWYDVRIQLW